MVIVPKKTPRRNARRSRRRRFASSCGQRRRTILDRIANRPGPERDQPMMTASNIHYELGDRVHGLSAGGIGAMLLLARTHRLDLRSSTTSSISSSAISPITNPTMS